VAKLRISVVQYLNTAPLVYGFTHGPLRGKYDLSFTVPSQCAEALRTGAADVAIIPAIEYQRIVSGGVDLAVLPDLAIASKERVRSLLLIARKPVVQVRSITLDQSSRSTQALVKLLCAQHWGISPEFRQAAPNLPVMLQNSDAALVIGDVALRIAIAAERRIKPGQGSEWVTSGAEIGIGDAGNVYIYDIVKEWWHLTELPAVLAVWAGRTSVITREVAADFISSRDFGMAHIPEICGEAAESMQLPESELRLYLEKNIDYTLDAENLRGLERFWMWSSSQGLIGPLAPVTIAAGPNSPVRYMDYIVAKKHA
jgi:chorismate dehydratase